MPPPPHPSRSPPQSPMAQRYMTLPPYTIQPSERFSCPSTPRHTSSGPRINIPENHLKSLPSDSPRRVYPFSPSQRKASTPNTMIRAPYDSPLHHAKTAESTKPQHVDSRFPGPLHIPSSPRFLDSPSPSPRDSPASTLIGTPKASQQSFRSLSPKPLPSWHDSGMSQKLPPIHHGRIHSSPRDILPQLTSARWNNNPYALKPSPRLQETPSPTPSSPESEEGTPPTHGFSPGSPYYDHSSYSVSPTQQRHLDANKDHFGVRYISSQETERQLDFSPQHKVNVSTHYATSDSSYYNSCEVSDYNETAHLVSRSRSKFGARRGSRFFCTYVSPLTGERCDIWDKGWTVYATLSRHAETEHAPEELDLMKRGELSYDQAQVITTREKRERIEDNLAQTGCCPDCGTIFSSKRRDSLSRHRQTSACEKAQKRGRPPTKFPKKPKGTQIQYDVDSSGETP